MSGEQILQLKWMRPTNKPFPHVWHRFEILTEAGKRLPVRVQDVTPDRHDDLWELFKSDFYPDHSLLRSVKTAEDQETMASQQWLVYELMKKKMCLVAVLDNDEQRPMILGGQLLYVFSKEDQPFPTLPGTARKKFIQYFNALCVGLDFFERLNVDKLLKDNGLVVRREFRQLKIASNLLIALENMARTFDIQATEIIFNNIKSQNMAEKYGLIFSSSWLSVTSLMSKVEKYCLLMTPSQLNVCTLNIYK